MPRRNFLGLLGAGVLGVSGSTSLVARELWGSAWHAYRHTFIDGQGRVIDYSSDEGFSTSEGQSYGLFFSLVAGDRGTFHRILNWTNTNLAGGRLGDILPAWKWGRHNGHWGVIGQNSAADADCWLAYTLLEAGRLWHDHNLGVLGARLATRITDDESAKVNDFGRVLLPGSSQFPHSPPVMVDPSYTPNFLAHGIATATSQHAWHEIAATQPKVIAKLAGSGFAPDWGWLPSAPSHPPSGLPHPGTGSFDAIRCYLWAGLTAPDAPGALTGIAPIKGMARYLATHPVPPEHVNVATGETHGTGPIGFSAALLPYLVRLKKHKSLSRQLRRVLGQRHASGVFGHPPHYYDESLIVFGLGGLSGVMQFSKEGKLQP